MGIEKAVVRWIESKRGPGAFRPGDNKRKNSGKTQA